MKTRTTLNEAVMETRMMCVKRRAHQGRPPRKRHSHDIFVHHATTIRCLLSLDTSPEIAFTGTSITSESIDGLICVAHRGKSTRLKRLEEMKL